MGPTREICPMCKKELPPPERAWETSGGELVCSYHCMRHYECVHGKKKKKKGLNV